MSQNYWVVIPTYNNEKTLKKVVVETLQITPNVIVVNDGSTDSTSAILGSIEGIQCIEYAENKGKGYALKLGFKKAQELNADFVVTIDSDGQHLVSDLPNMIEAGLENPGAVIMGARNMQQEGVPQKSSFGNSFSNFWFWAETGIKLSDTQTGFRVYPLKPIAKTKFFTHRFEFEIEVIVRLAWQNVPFKEIPVGVLYPEDRVSHFRPSTDFFRISVLNTVLFTLALVFYLPRLFVLRFNAADSLRFLWKELTSNVESPLKISFAIGVGLFFGIFPIWGAQMLVAFAVATFFKLNRALVLFSSNISIPPVLPFIIWLSYKIGAGFVANPKTLSSIDELQPESIYLHVTQYGIGACVLAVAAGVTGFVLSWLLMVGLRLFRKVMISK